MQALLPKAGHYTIVPFANRKPEHFCDLTICLMCGSLHLLLQHTVVPALIIADAACPLLPWVMKPFPDNGNLPIQNSHFNYRLSRARMVVENAFGCLKGRWSCLL